MSALYSVSVTAAFICEVGEPPVRFLGYADTQCHSLVTHIPEEVISTDFNLNLANHNNKYFLL